MVSSLAVFKRPWPVKPRAAVSFAAVGCGQVALALNIKSHQ